MGPAVSMSAGRLSVRVLASCFRSVTASTATPNCPQLPPNCPLRSGSQLPLRSPPSTTATWGFQTPLVTSPPLRPPPTYPPTCLHIRHGHVACVQRPPVLVGLHDGPHITVRARPLVPAHIRGAALPGYAVYGDSHACDRGERA